MNNFMLRFVPPSITKQNNPEEYRKARLLLNCCAVLGLIATAYVGVSWWLGFSSVAILLLVIVVPMFCTVPFIFRANGSLVQAGNTLGGMLVAFFMFAIYRDGGLFSPLIAFMPLAVMLAMFFAGTRAESKECAGQNQSRLGLPKAGQT